LGGDEWDQGWGDMTESDLNTREAAAGKRPWGTPRIIVSEIAKRTEVVGATSPSPVDFHNGGTTQNGS
jgi:hypothetical protein